MSKLGVTVDEIKNALNDQNMIARAENLVLNLLLPELNLLIVLPSGSSWLPKNNFPKLLSGVRKMVRRYYLVILPVLNWEPKTTVQQPEETESQLLQLQYIRCRAVMHLKLLHKQKQRWKKCRKDFQRTSNIRNHWIPRLQLPKGLLILSIRCLKPFYW